MERKLEEIDEILASYEDWMHGINGEQCTKARKLLSEVQQQLKILNIPVVMAMLPSDEEIKQQMTTDHYCHDKGRYRKIRLDRIQGGKIIRDLIKQRIEGNLP